MGRALTIKDEKEFGEYLKSLVMESEEKTEWAKRLAERRRTERLRYL